MYTSLRRRGRLGRTAITGFGLALAATALVVPHAMPVYADAAGKGGDFVPLSPSGALLDTRNGTGGVTGPRTAGSTATFLVRGRGGVPAAGVSAVLVDVTAVSPTAATHLTLWPDGSSRPALSMVTAAANQIISNSAVVPVGANGRLALFNNAGSTHVTVDVQGYFTETAGGAGGGFVPVNHTRLVDTRSGLGGAAGAIAAGGSRTFTLTGGVIPAGAAAAFLDLIVTGATDNGWLAAYPAGGSGRSVMDFETGTTTHGAAVKLAADGRVTFANHSNETIHLVVTGQGYFTTSSASGAGLRTVPVKRVLDTRSGSGVGSGGTVDVQVGGTNGLPTRGIAGAVLNVTAVSPTESGTLKAWPVGGAEPIGTVVNFPAGRTRAALSVVQLGTSARVRIKNTGSSSVHILVDLQGWFAHPLPVLPIEQFSRMSVLQAAPVGTALGALEYSYVDNIGRVRHAHQSDPDFFGSVQWTAVGEGPAFTGQPALSQLASGEVQIAAQNRDGDVWTISQPAPGGTWGSWADQGGSMATPPVAARLSDGTTVLFAVDVDGKLWHLRAAGTGWRSLGDADLAGQVTVVRVDTGLRLFALTTTGTTKTATYTTGGALSGWTDLGAAGSTGTPAAVVYPGFQARVFVRAADGSVLTLMQDASGAWPAQWQSTGAFTAAGSPAAALDVSGRTAVVVRGADNEIYVSFETAQGSGAWGNWVRTSPDISDPAATDPTIAPFTNSSGQTWLIAFRNVNDSTRLHARQLPAVGVTRAATAGDPAFTRHTLTGPAALAAQLRPGGADSRRGRPGHPGRQESVQLLDG
jgi:hypothetical protein